MADLKALVKRMAEEKGLGEYWPVIDWMVQNESSWNQGAHNTKDEDSVGLFQLNRAGGLGTGKSVEYLKNPQNNAEIALSNIAASLRGGASLQQALRPWSVTHGVDVNKIAGGVTAAGGVVMTNGQTQTPTKNQSFWDWLEEQGFISGPQSYVIEATGETVTLPGGGLKDGVTANMINDLWAKFSGSQGAGATPQETAVSQQSLDIALAKAQADMQEQGLSVAAQNFANQIAQLQEGRSTAEYAQEYERRIAPPGMTTVPYTGPTSAVGQLQSQIGMTPSPAIPLQQAPVTDPYQALQQAQQFVPQAPNLQFQAPQLPQQAPQLAGMGMSGTALPTGGETDFVARVASLKEAMRRLFGQVEAMQQPGVQLPIGGR